MFLSPPLPPPTIVGPHVLILAGRSSSQALFSRPAGPCGGSCKTPSAQVCNSGLYRTPARVRSRQAFSLRKFLPVGPQALTDALSAGNTCRVRPRRRRRSSVRAQRSDGAQRDCIFMIRAVSYSDLSKSTTLSARFVISAQSSERNVVQQGLRRRALRRRDLRRRDLRRRRAAVLSGPARHGSRSGSTSCR